MSDAILNFCRCCLSKQTEVNVLIDMNEKSGEVSLLDMFLESSSVVLTKNAGKSHKICKACAELLRSAFFFRLLCRTADKAIPRPVEETSKPWIEVAQITKQQGQVLLREPNTASNVIQLSSDDSEDEVNPHSGSQHLENSSKTDLNSERDLVTVKKLTRQDNTPSIPGFDRLSMKEEQALLKREVDKMVAEYYPAEVTHQCPYCLKMFEHIEHLLQHISELH